MYGMPRRVATYQPEDGFSTLNLISSCGAAVLGIAMIVFVVNVIVSLRRRRPAGSDPWGGFTLEWFTTSPPPPLNFEGVTLPPITSYAPLLDLRDRTRTPS
jgi:cytochrome c oxidase subunit 1